MNKIINGDCFNEIKNIESNSIQLVVTSPPYAMMIDCDDYKGIKDEEYVDWLLPLIKEISRVLKTDGSFILNIDSNARKGFRATYCHELVYRVVKETNLKLYDEYVWCKKASIPSPENRLHHRHEHLFHFSKGKPTLYPENIMVDKKEKALERQKYEIKNSGKRNEKGIRESDPKMIRDTDKTKPSSLLYFNTAAAIRHDIKHPAPFHPDLPEFFIKYTTKEGDIVLDPFNGRGTTTDTAKSLNRKYIGIELNPYYISNNYTGKIERIDNDGNIVEYDNVNEAATINNLIMDNINSCCRGRSSTRKTAGGYYWRWQKINNDYE